MEYLENPPPVEGLSGSEDIGHQTKANAATVVESGTADLRDAAKQGDIGVKPAAEAARDLTDEGQAEVIEDQLHKGG